MLYNEHTTILCFSFSRDEKKLNGISLRNKDLCFLVLQVEDKTKDLASELSFIR